jgi:hypothetical protein
VEPRLIFVENISESSIIFLAEFSIIFLEQVLVRFVFGRRQNVAKYGHVRNLVVNHPCIEFCDPHIANVLHYSSTIISYVLNVRMLGLNPQTFNLESFSHL